MVKLQLIDFQRNVSIDRQLIEELQRFVILKEVELIDTILNAVPFVSASEPLLPSSRIDHFKLADAVELFGKKAARWVAAADEPLKSGGWRPSTSHINQAFRHYFELLEGSMEELFLQMEQLKIDEWGRNRAFVFKLLKDLLYQKIHDLLSAATAMQKEMATFASSWQQRLHPFTYFFYRTSPFDKALIGDIRQARRRLLKGYERFSKRFEQFEAIDSQVLEALKELEEFQALFYLDDEKREAYRKLFSYLKFREYDSQCSLFSQLDFLRAIRQVAATHERALDLFTSYASELDLALFHQSRLLKRNRYASDPGAKEITVKMMTIYRDEIASLSWTMEEYRRFLDGLDLKKVEKGLSLADARFVSLINSVQEGGKRRWVGPIQIDQGVQRTLYEMSQPLASYKAVKKRGERVLSHLKEVDELGASDPLAVSYGEEVIRALLRADWKYHLLHEIPLYEELYAVHQGIMGRLDDRKHLNRVMKFTHLIEEMEMWVKQHETAKHERDIELDINDLKGYFQDFFAEVQRAESSQLEALSYQLLLYRNLFGKFFYHLRTIGGQEATLIYHRLLFVDQYLDSIDKKLEELKTQPHQE